MHSWGQLCGLANQTTTYDISISYSHWFESQLLHFRSNSLLMTWESSRRWFHHLGSCNQVEELGEVPGFGLVQPWSLWPFVGMNQ